MSSDRPCAMANACINTTLSAGPSMHLLADRWDEGKDKTKWDIRQKNTNRVNLFLQVFVFCLCVRVYVCVFLMVSGCMWKLVLL